ncbi:MAG: glycine C-acetyltransferase [Acidimicrobiia bacterium]|nr:glycine C-acetyltransferase [Acidimicrobiia bacterium]MDH5521709.1 glycine C-acetyltransferase [Acidimicrobiia bacterium]
MSRTAFYERLAESLREIEADGLWKAERVIVSPQGGEIEVEQDGVRRSVLNLCANNYLGLADNPEIMAAAREATDSRGFGMASVRFICGTQDLHRRLERSIAEWLGTDDAITFAACFDANGAVFEPLLGPEDAIVSDSLNHASIIDGIRLCKAARHRFATGDLTDLEAKVGEAKAAGARTILIVTDGVFSMDGIAADVAGICEIADRHGCLVMVDDCHATGFIGPEGRGTPALHGVSDRVDIVTSTLGKALGGGMGGFVAARSEIVDLLRQRARPYLFSNAVAPPLVAGAIKAIELARAGDDLRDRIAANAAHFRSAMGAAGFTLAGRGHPIIPVMLGDAVLAAEFARRLLDRDVYVTAFSFPVVPRDTARIRTQMSAAHSTEQLDRAIEAFIAVGRELEVVA